MKKTSLKSQHRPFKHNQRVAASGSAVARKFNDDHKNCRRWGYAGPFFISKAGMDLSDNSRHIDMRIVEIRRKLLEQKPSFCYVI